MGFFDNVLNKLKDAAETVAKEAESAINAATGAANASNYNTASNSSAARPAQGIVIPSSEPAAPKPDYGCSWGPEMPDEENQYNFSGSYDQYFYAVYAQAFPEYRLTSESIRQGRATLINFWQGERKVLVVELMSDTSSANRIRESCRREHVAYLRFYYNHPGWWNTKAYVIARTGDALK